MRLALEFVLTALNGDVWLPPFLTIPDARVRQRNSIGLVVNYEHRGWLVYVKIHKGATLRKILDSYTHGIYCVLTLNRVVRINCTVSYKAVKRLKSACDAWSYFYPQSESCMTTATE